MRKDKHVYKEREKSIMMCTMCTSSGYDMQMKKWVRIITDGGFFSGEHIFGSQAGIMRASMISF